MSLGCSCAATCELPAGTESDGTDCDYGKGGCTLSVLKAAEMNCTSGYNGVPAKANAICGSGTSPTATPRFYLGTSSACNNGGGTVLTASICSTAFTALGLSETSTADGAVCYKNGEGDGRQDGGNGGGAKLVCDKNVVPSSAPTATTFTLNAGTFCAGE